MTRTSTHRTIPGTDLEVFPLSLGGNVFGWTCDEATSFEVLDTYVAGGGNFIDTADSYSAWAAGNVGGESERIIGKWMAARGNRDSMIIATKVGSKQGLSAAKIGEGVEASLTRLGTDRIDLYYAHKDDAKTPLAETVAAFAELVKAGKVRAVAGSNYTADRLAQALQIAEEISAPSFVALQMHYNLMHRSEFEGQLQDLVVAKGLVTLPYYSLASGFLTGKYRDGSAVGSSPRAEGAAGYLDERGRRVLAALDLIAGEHSTGLAAVALAWLAAQPTVIAPIASASKVSQVAGLLASAQLRLTPSQIIDLTVASG